MFHRLAARFRARTHRGQMLIIVAAAMVALVGIMGLAIDLGYTFVQKRAVQNAADAGALAGAQLLTTWSSSNNIAVQSTVQAIVAANAVGPITPTLESCIYVDDTLQNVGACTNTVPATASGVQLVVSETHSTFFIRAIPGAPTTASTSATSTARVYQVANAPGDAPFIVCGGASGADAAPNPNAPQYARGPGAAPGGSIMVRAVYQHEPSQGASSADNAGGATGSPRDATASMYPRVIGPDLAKKSTPTPTPSPTSTATPTGTATPTPTATVTSGTTLLVPGTATINPSAVGLTFLLHGPQVDTCGAGSNSFKGLADNSGANDTAGIPGWWATLPGVRAGPTRFTVSGLNGCQANATLDGCVLLIPVADQGTGNGSNVRMHVVAVAAFAVHSCGANCHDGTLLGQFTIAAGTSWPPSPQTGWLPGDKGVIMVRLAPSGNGKP